MKCPYCESVKFIKHGFQGSKQRYRCKNCGRTFTPKTRDIYSRTEKRLLSLLLNFLENDFEDRKKLKEVLEASKEYREEIGKIRIESKATEPKIKKHYKKNENPKDIEIECFNAKMLICVDNKNITLYKIPDGELSDNLSESDKNKKSRTITILDTVEKKNLTYIS